MKLIEANKVEQTIKDYWKAQVDKALTLTDGNEAIKRINSYLKHNHELLKAIGELPSAEPDTTTHDSIPAKKGKNDGDGTSGDCISRQAESNPLEKCYTCKHVYQRVSDADTLYCRCRKGCRYEEFKPKRSNCTAEKS